MGVTTTATTAQKPSKPGAPTEIDQLLEHPSLWRARQLDTHTRQSNQGLPTGFDELDSHLPDQGWPNNGLIELLLAHAGIGELRLLMPALKMLSEQESRWIAWVNPPFIPYAPALHSLGIDTRRILLVRPQTHKDALWALERICKSGNCSSALAWLDERKLKLKDTQRLQVAAKQGRTLTGLFRPQQAMQQSSMAELRLRLLPSQSPGLMQLEILKRRGGWALQGQQGLTLDVAAATASRRHTAHDMREQIQLWRMNRINKHRQSPEQTQTERQVAHTDTAAKQPVVAPAIARPATPPVSMPQRSPTGLH